MQYVTGGGNPYTAQKVCGSGYKMVDSAALGSAGTVYLLYNTANDNNCVATMKATSLGTATAATAYLEVQGKKRVTQSGNVTHYAGPVRAYALDKCVKWGGKIGSSPTTAPSNTACPNSGPFPDPRMVGTSAAGERGGRQHVR